MKRVYKPVYNPLHRHLPTSERIAKHLELPFAYGGVRVPYMTANNIVVSIQQSEWHHSSDGTYEMSCPHSDLLAPYCTDADYPIFSYVPFDAVVKYIDEIEAQV